MSASREMIVTVFIEQNDQYIELKLSETDYNRAIIDSDYLQRLVDLQSRREPEVEPESLQSRQEPEVEPAQLQSRSEPEVNENSPHQDPLAIANNENAGPSSIFIWHENTIFLLLTLYEERRDEFLTKRQKKVYDDIARKMQETNPLLIVTGGQCQSKINSLKKTYKKILDHNNKSGNDRATWPFFDRMNEVFGTTGWANPVATASEAGPPEISELAPNESAAIPKKRRLEHIFQDFFAEKKKLMAERNEYKKKTTEALIKMKEAQHKEKMDILRELVNRNRGGLEDKKYKPAKTTAKTNWWRNIYPKEPNRLVVGISITSAKGLGIEKRQEIMNNLVIRNI